MPITLTASTTVKPLRRAASACSAGTHQPVIPKAGSLVALPPAERFDFAHGNGQFAAGRQFVAADLRAFEQNHVFVRFQRDVVDDAHGAKKESHVAGQLPANARDTFQERRLLSAAHELDQTQTHFDGQRLHLQQSIDVLFGCGGFQNGFALFGRSLLFLHVPGGRAQTRTHHEERNCR